VKILIYLDDKTAIDQVLRIGTALSVKLNAEITFLTARSTTPATEEPPPVGVDLPREQWNELQPGIKVLTQAMTELIDRGFLSFQSHINIRAVRNGYLFLAETLSGDRVPFYERYGHLTEILNHEVDEHRCDMVVVAAPRRSGLGRFVPGDRTRKLVLDLHGSVFLVRGGDLYSRFLVCADGSPSARRLFPLLKKLLPAAQERVDLMWVEGPGLTEEEIGRGREYIERARVWLDRCGKKGELLMREGDRPQDLIVHEARFDSVIVMGASLKHDVHHRVRGSLPLQVLSKTESSLLLVKLPPELDIDFFNDFDNC
jgi:nucleotide-binding universal stress UspA family protein